MPTNPTHLLWCDLETTGLEPHKGDMPLEFAFKLTTFDFSEKYPRGNTLWSYSKVVHFSRSEAAGLKYSNSFVFDMHTQNGLLEECAASDVSCADVEIQVVSFLKNQLLDFGITDSKQLLLAGSSIHFDRKWLDWFTPDISELLHYRIMDVSSLYPVLDMLGLPRKPRPKAHRAMTDIDRSIGELTDILDVIRTK